MDPGRFVALRLLPEIHTEALVFRENVGNIRKIINVLSTSRHFDYMMICS